MSFLQKINPLNWGGDTLEIKQELPLDALMRRVDEMNKAAAGITVTPRNAMQSPTVAAVVNGTANAMAQLPFTMVEKVSDTERKPLPDHNITERLNLRPNGWQTRFDYWSKVISDLLLWGNFYALKNRSVNGRIVTLQPLDPWNVQVEQLDTLALAYTATDKATTQIYPQNRIHHIRFNVGDTIKGSAPPLQCAEAIATEIAIQRFGASLFASGALPHVVVERPGRFKDEESRAKFGQSFKSTYGGKRGTIVLEEGWTIKALQMNNEESQFLESRKLQRQIIAGLYGMPPHRVGDLERATFSNIEHQSLEFVVYCMTPLLVRIEESIVRDMIPKQDQGKLQAKFNVKALLRGDFKSRQEGLQIQRQNGIITANEWRKVEDMSQLDGPEGEELITPLNMGGSGDQPPPAEPPAEQIGGEPPQGAQAA